MTSNNSFRSQAAFRPVYRESKPITWYIFWFLISAFLGEVFIILIGDWGALLGFALGTLITSFLAIKEHTISFFLETRINAGGKNEELSFIFPISIGKMNFILLIILLLFALAGGQDDCVSRAQTAHGWDKDIYHNCKDTPEGFRW